MSSEKSSVQARPPSEDVAYMRDVSAALQSERYPSALWAILICGLTIGIFLTWASLSEVDEITKAQGRVITSARDQIIQSLDPGVIAEIFVKEGQEVESGQPLLRIDDTRSGANFHEAENKVLALAAGVARLKAQTMGNSTIDFPPEVMQRPELVKQEKALFISRKDALEKGLSEMQYNLSVVEREIAITAPMVNKGVVSEVELLKLRQQASGLRLQITDRNLKYQADANTDLTRFSSELEQAREAMIGREDAFRRAVITAPMSGIVKNIKVTTVGGVVAPGEEIMQLVPTNDKLVIEAFVKPTDIAFLRPGLPATVKILAYDYSIYGGLQGTVADISADTIQNDRRSPPPPGQEADHGFYRVIVTTESSMLNVGNGKPPIQIFPGLTATVEIKTGRKTILSYLLKPVFKAREAFHER